MSWVAGAMQGAGLLGDLAGTVAQIVLHNKQLNIMNSFNQAQIQLAKDQLKQNLELANQYYEFNANLPANQYNSAVGAGFDSVSARQLAGSHEVRYLGGQQTPILHQGQQHQMMFSSKHLMQAQHVIGTFHRGTPGVTPSKGLPKPQGVTTTPKPQGITATVPVVGATTTHSRV
ncbi:minor structural protein [Porcine sapovirus]|uniref:Minor structural protein n=2 Tax=Sapporo virus TaxID=95342 RepID=A0A0U3DHV5_9CALI|nr:ORF2 [Sapovirus swine/OH-JJ259/00/US]ALV13254.1 minor structural protein [Porcine sapovirus]